MASICRRTSSVYNAANQMFANIEADMLKIMQSWEAVIEGAMAALGIGDPIEWLEQTHSQYATLLTCVEHSYTWLEVRLPGRERMVAWQSAGTPPCACVCRLRQTKPWGEFERITAVLRVVCRGVHFQMASFRSPARKVRPGSRLHWQV